VQDGAVVEDCHLEGGPLTHRCIRNVFLRFLFTVLFYVFTARSELRKVLFLALSVTFFAFLFVYEISRELRKCKRICTKIHTKDVFGSSLGQV